MIKKIVIENFKSIEKVQFDFENPMQEIVCLIGKNGAGKSNIFKALKYFFEHIDKPYSGEEIIDNSNPYLQFCKISVTFDLSKLFIKSRQNQNLFSRFEIIKAYIEKVYGQEWGYNSTISDEDNFQIELTLMQYRDGNIGWNINDKQIRKTIKSLFPFYFFDTRTLDLFTWDKLWQIINDLTITVSEKEQTECVEILDNAFESIYGEKYTKSAKILEDVFDENKIAFDTFRFESRFKSALSVRFGGEKFTVNKRSLDYYSDGTNSYYYLLLLTRLIPKISEISCKYPIVIIDEPEIGLHSEYIKRFVISVFEHINNNAFMMFSTHSPLLICNLTNIQANYSLYKVSHKQQHSVINKMNTSWLAETKHRITVKETECYFADYLVYVEGETEIQLFHDKYLLLLFPWLEKIHFYSFDSNNERLREVSSNALNLGTEYRLLIDMDKIICYNKKSKKYSIKTDRINPLYRNNIQKYDFYNGSKEDMSSLLKQIQANLQRCYNPNGTHYIDDIEFNDLIKDIQKFCLLYNVIVNWTTIEGEIITYENINEFINFLSGLTVDKNAQQQHSQILQVTDDKEKTCLILCEFEGRTENYIEKNSVKFGGKRICSIAKKTSGWINKWLKYYFTQNIDPVEDHNAKISVFQRDFPGLFSTLQTLKKMIDYSCE